MKRTSFAGFGIRFVAFAIDAVLVGAAWWLLSILLGFAYVSVTGSAAFVSWFGTIAFVLFCWVYFAGFESSRRGATLGKRAVGIRVTDLSGKRISFARASARYYAKFLSAALFCVGFCMIIWNRHRRGLHDMLARTLVLKGAAVEKTN